VSRCAQGHAILECSPCFSGENGIG
jgi:hypothetical protein